MVKILEKYEFPEGLYYSKDHMWAKIEGGKVRVGLTDYGRQNGWQNPHGEISTLRHNCGARKDSWNHGNW